MTERDSLRTRAYTSGGGRLRRLCDLAAGSDPGLTRLRSAANAAVAMATALGVERIVASIRDAGDQSTIIAMILGAVVAMMGATALTGTDPWEKTRTAAGFPIAIGTGVVVGTAVSGHDRLMLFLFVGVMFVAVFVRRFGGAFFFYGFMLWMGYFFASFLHTTWALVPDLLLAVVIGAAWVLLLSLTVLRTRPARTLARIRRSFGARGRRLTATLTVLLQTSPDDARYRARLRRRLRSQETQLVEAALMIEAWSAERGALPSGWSAPGLRRRVLDTQLALDRIATAGEELADAEPEVRLAAARVTDSFSSNDVAGVREALGDLSEARATDPETSRAQRRLAAATEDHLRLAEKAGVPPQPGPVEFVPSVELAMGNLPSSVSVAMDVSARGHRLNPLRRVDFSSRQAVQAAIAGGLAIVLGKQLDATRYYWAVIAAFVAFAGVGTRFETTLKAVYRVLGTLVGLFAGVALAGLTQGHIVWILFTVVASMFCGFYLVRVNYAYMIFFVTIVIAQLYTILGQYSDQLLVLRLEETVVGAVAGIAVGLLLTPLSTRDTVRVAQRDLYAALAAFLEAVAGHPPRDADEPTDLDAMMREVDNQLRDLLLVTAPLSRRLLWGNSPSLLRHQVTVIGRAVGAARLLGSAVRGVDDPDPVVRRSSTALAAALRTMGDRPSLFGAATQTDHEVTATLDESDTELFGSPENPADSDDSRTVVAWRALVRLQAALRELARPQPAETNAP